MPHKSPRNGRHWLPELSSPIFTAISIKMQQLIDVINLLNYICHFFAAARQPACRFSPFPTASHPRSCCTQWEASTNGQKSVVGSQFMGQRNCVWAEEERDVSSLACAASADGNRLATGQLYCGSISFQPLLIGKARSPSAAEIAFPEHCSCVIPARMAE